MPSRPSKTFCLALLGNVGAARLIDIVFGHPEVARERSDAVRTRLVARHQQLLGEDDHLAALVPCLPVEILVDQAFPDRIAALLVATAIAVDDDLAGQTGLLDSLRTANGHNVIGTEDGAHIRVLLQY